jgi:hypothetical protein
MNDYFRIDQTQTTQIGAPIGSEDVELHACTAAVGDPQYFYLHWTDGESNLDEGIGFGTALAQASGLPMEVGMPQLNQIPDEQAKLAHFTERSRGSLRIPRVVLLLHPANKLMSHGRPGDGSYAVGVEFATEKLHGWAAFTGAFNIKSKETMSPQLSAAARELYERIEFNGNNGWADAPGKRDAIRDLRELKDKGERDVDLLRGCMLARVRTSDVALERLVKLVERVA